MRVSYAIVFVGDMNRSVAFYRDVVGLTLRFQTPGWTEFSTDGATLALHAADAPQPPCIQEPKDVFGARIAQYLDPDGLAISVSEERRTN
jgi:catechol 2,3-dioxygenase-like lactoylglutathione lyase family enzyme